MFAFTLIPALSVLKTAGILCDGIFYYEDFSEQIIGHGKVV